MVAIAVVPETKTIDVVGAIVVALAIVGAVADKATRVADTKASPCDKYKFPFAFDAWTTIKVFEVSFHPEKWVVELKGNQQYLSI